MEKRNEKKEQQSTTAASTIGQQRLSTYHGDDTGNNCGDDAFMLC
jgi:hypothetical protein